jgi:hypothetical protein
LPPDQLTNDPPQKNGGGGDKRSADAKMLTLQREEQIVALRLRHVPFAAIGRQLGVSKQAAQNAFYRALRANTKTDIQTVHRTELAELELQHARAWQVIADHPTVWQAVVSALNTMNRINIRRAKLMGLDAPMKLDIRSIYGTGTDDAAADRQMRARVLASMPVADQIRWYEDFDEAKRRLDETPVGATGNPIDGPDQHTDDTDEE